MARWDGMFPLFETDDASQRLERFRQTVIEVQELRQALLPNAAGFPMISLLQEKRTAERSTALRTLTWWQGLLRQVRPGGWNGWSPSGEEEPGHLMNCASASRRDRRPMIADHPIFNISKYLFRTL
jgi:hypothetical protein